MHTLRRARWSLGWLVVLSFVATGTSTGCRRWGRSGGTRSTDSRADRRETVPFAMGQREAEDVGRTGARHAGAEGSMGAGGRGARYAIRSARASPQLSRSAAHDAVTDRGIFAALGAPGGALAPFGGRYGSGSGGFGSHGMPTEDAPNATVTIDPNGRFATTYRPGAGHLAAFEAALSNGTVPASARQLVGDLADRYAPAIDPPATGALTARVDLERALLAPGGGPFRLRIALRSAATLPAGRPRMSVHLVIDTSGSMSGASIDNARTAARTLVARLHAGDTFSLTRFSDTAEVLVRRGPVGERRAAIQHAIESLHADGGTNIHDGLSAGYREASGGRADDDPMRIVMLVSDGRATSGDTNPQAIEALVTQAFQHEVQTSSFGVGSDYDGPLMSSIADRGAGGYYYVRESASIAQALATELDARLQPVAQALEVRVRLRSDVELVSTYGSRRLDETETAQVRAQEIAVDRQSARRDRITQNRQHDLDGGMRFFIPGFARDDAHAILLGLRVPSGTGERAIASIELRYKDRVLGRNVTLELPVRARYADSDAASVASADASVGRTIQGFDAGETLMRASMAVERGDRARAVALLLERAEILRAAGTRWSDAAMRADAARFDRFRELVGGATPMSEPLVLALLLDTSARVHMH